MKGPSTSFAGPPPLENEGRKFGAAAEQLAGLGAMLLGWRPDEFWSATPAELATALTPFMSETDGPEPDTIAALRKRFPDEEPTNHGR